MGIGVKHSSAAIDLHADGYWSAEPQRWSKHHERHTKRFVRKRVALATVLIWLSVVLVTISLTAMITVVNGETVLSVGRTDPIYAGHHGGGVHRYRHVTYGNDIRTNSDLDEMSDDEEQEEEEDESNSIDGRLSTADIDKLHAIVMQGLRLTRIPDVANVSSVYAFL